MPSEEFARSDDRPVFPRDPGFPQLEVAGDPVRMLEVFRAHLEPLPGRACVILDCLPFRFRCRQSTSRCVLQYTLRLSDPETGRQWDQWVTGLIYSEPGAAQAVWHRLRSSDLAAEIPEPWRQLQPVSFVPELDMVIEVFPFDRRLPQLGQVLNGATRDLEPLLLALLGPGDWHAGPATLEPRRYRAELGAVLRYALPARDAASGRSASTSCYLKVYRNREGEATFDRLRAWSERAGRQPPGYSLVRPLAYWSELRTLVLEEAQGISLHERLLEDSDPEAAVRAVARALAGLNQDQLPIERVHVLADQIDQLKRASALIQWACPEKRAKIGGVSAVVARSLEEVAPAPFHRDLTTEHALVSGDQVSFIDTDSIAMGDPVRDPALLFAHIASTVALHSVPRERALAIGTAFVEEYFAHVPASWRKRFRLHCAGAFIEVAAGIFRAQPPAWQEKVAQVAANARHALAGEFG